MEDRVPAALADVLRKKLTDTKAECAKLRADLAAEKAQYDKLNQYNIDCTKKYSELLVAKSFVESDLRDAKNRNKDVVEGLNRLIEYMNRPYYTPYTKDTLDIGPGQKYLVFKIDDLIAYAPEYAKLVNLLSNMVDEGRKRDGKPFNKYIVINGDEAYSQTVLDLMSLFGHGIDTTSDEKDT